MSLQREIWINEVIKLLWNDDSFINASKDYSALVENGKIHIPKAKSKPDIQDTVATYTHSTASNAANTKPIDKQYLDEDELELTLKTYNTKEMIVRDIHQFALNYDKIQLATETAIDTIRDKIAIDTAHAWAGGANVSDSIVVKASGTATSGNRKPVKIEDIIKVAESMDLRNLPKEGRVLLLHPTHQADLRTQDVTLYHQLTNKSRFYGFEVYTSNALPQINRTNGNLLAIGATTNATPTSIFWHKGSVCRMNGVIKMFDRINSSDINGSGYSFQVTYRSAKLRDNAVGALYGENA